jgi:hypothetical protein
MPCLERRRARRRPEGPAPTIIIYGWLVAVEREEGPGRSKDAGY